MNERNLLAERLRDVIQDGLVQDARAWCEAAGLSGGFLSSFFVRAKSKPDASISADNVTALAKVAGVRADWLLTGEGPRERRAEQAVQLTPRYAALREVLEAHPTRWSVAAVTVAEQRALKADVDPGAAWWEEQLDRLDNAIRLAELPMNAIAPKVPQRERPSAAAQRPDALGRPPKATGRGE